jgi:hypothetical protein
MTQIEVMESRRLLDTIKSGSFGKANGRDVGDPEIALAPTLRSRPNVGDDVAIVPVGAEANLAAGNGGQGPA